MISKKTVISSLVSMVLMTQVSWAQSPVNNLEDAEQLMVQVGEELGSENDTNAVFVTSNPVAKVLLVEILRGLKKKSDIEMVKNADYVAVVVQNHDENKVYYYVINKGQTQAVEVGETIHIADLEYYVCPMNDKKSTLPGKFAQAKNLLLGLDPQQPVVGTVWFEDYECEEN